ncbi:MAG: Fe(3+) ABC transporter substrate-binding protein [Rhodospirillaceae bacterium]
MKLRALAALALFTAPVMAPAAVTAEEVNIYSYRQENLVRPIFDAFTKDTGIKVNVVYAPKGLVQRMQAEGRNSPADLVLTVDIARLTEVVDAGLAQPVESETLTAAVPAEYRQSEGLWYGLTLRARLIYASKDRVQKGEITSYEQLADPKWRGRICTRPGDHDYNVGLLAAMIAHYGEEKAEEWLRGVKANLARKPQGNDRAQVKAIMDGVCDLAIGNHYYMALMLNDDKQKEWAASANIVFPTIAGIGTHMNISGVLLAKHAPNRTNAVRMMEYMAGKKAQQIYAEENYEYPVDESVTLAPVLASWGTYKRDTLSLEKIAGNRATALKIVNKVGYNDGPTTN